MLGGINCGIMRWFISVPLRPYGRPYHPYETKKAKHHAPTEDIVQRERHHRGQPSRQMSAAKKNSLHASLLSHRHPARKRPRHAGPCPSLARAEKKSYDNERSQIQRRPGRHRKGRPPQNNAGEHLARTQSVGHPRSGNLEHGIGQCKCTKHHTHLLLAQRQISLDRRGQCGDTRPVEVGDHRQ